MATILDSTYCYEKCLIGKAASDVYLTLNNSVVAAAAEFNIFTENCHKVCPYRHANENYEALKEI